MDAPDFPPGPSHDLPIRLASKENGHKLQLPEESSGKKETQTTAKGEVPAGGDKPQQLQADNADEEGQGEDKNTTTVDWVEPSQKKKKKNKRSKKPKSKRGKVSLYTVHWDYRRFPS